MDAFGLQRELPADLLDRLDRPSPPFYLHRPPTWLWRGALALTAALSALAFGFALHALWSGQAGVAELGVGIFGLPFLLITLQPRRWRPPVACVADVRGLHFLGSVPDSAPSFLPWSDIVGLEIGYYSEGQGLTRSVVLMVKADSTFWNPSLPSRIAHALSQPALAAGHRRFPIGSRGQRATRTLAALQRLQALWAASRGERGG